MSDLAESGWIDQNTVTQLCPDLLYQYHISHGHEDLQMVQGIFY